MDKNLTIIEIRLRLLRDIKGITQKELAKALNISRALVNSWENGYTDISIKMLVKIAYYFKVPIDYILGLTTKFNKSIYNYQSELDRLFLGKRLRIIRKVNNLNQDELAKLMHIDRSCISNYERGKFNIPITYLKDICNTFGYSADWCVGNTLECIKRNKKVIIKDEDINTIISI